jgi:hypothetical protein
MSPELIHELVRNLSGLGLLGVGAWAIVRLANGPLARVLAAWLGVDTAASLGSAELREELERQLAPLHDRLADVEEELIALRPGAALPVLPSQRTRESERDESPTPH